MERLTNTKLFCLLEKMDGTFNPGEQDIAHVYNDFVRAVASLCASARGDVPAYFTLHYTRLELSGIQILLNDEGAGKNVRIRNCIVRCLAFIEIALSWVGDPALKNHPPGYIDHLFIQHDYGFKKIASNTIQYIKASSSYCEVHLTDGSAMVVSVPLSEVVSQLSCDSFIRIHRSFDFTIFKV